MIDFCCSFTSFHQENIFYYLVPPRSKLVQEWSATLKNERYFNKTGWKAKSAQFFCICVDNKYDKETNKIISNKLSKKKKSILNQQILLEEDLYLSLFMPRA